MANIFKIKYDWFEDIILLMTPIDKFSILRYSPKKPSIVEFALNSNLLGSFKVPIIETNVKEEFIGKISHNINFSINHDNEIILEFNNEYLSVKSKSTNSQKAIDLTNDKFFSISNIDISDNEEEYDLNSLNSANIINNNLDLDYNNYPNYDIIRKEFKFTFDINQKFFIEKISNCENISEDMIKNVICYFNIEHVDVKYMIKNLNYGKINISLENGKITFKSVSPKLNKEIIKTINVVMINNCFKNTTINFSINGLSLSKLKSINIPFRIYPSQNKKIFKKIEIKLVSSNSCFDEINSYGLTIFPGNITNREILLNQTENFDLYSSLMFFIPQLK